MYPFYSEDEMRKRKDWLTEGNALQRGASIVGHAFLFQGTLYLFFMFIAFVIGALLS